MLKSFIVRGKLRLYIVEVIIIHLTALVVNAIASELSLNNRSTNNQYKLVCLSDGKLILHYILYSFLIGDVALIDHECLDRLKQTYSTVGCPFNNIVNFIYRLKNKTILLVNQIASEELELTFEKYYSTYSSLTSELASYFDITIEILANS